MRELILQRIQEIKEHTARGLHDDAFDKRDGRWSQLEVDGVHISDIDFSTLKLDQLARIFEHIVRRYYTQR